VESPDGICRVEQVVINLMQPSDATELFEALQVMQQRAHSDIHKLAKVFQDTMSLYEQQKVAQLQARAQLASIAETIQVLAYSPRA
jgi:hypothetical protein